MTFALERGVVAPKGTPKEKLLCGQAITRRQLMTLAYKRQWTAALACFQGPAEFKAYSEKLYNDYEAVAIEIGMYKNKLTLWVGCLLTPISQTRLAVTITASHFLLYVD